ncbi:glycoside hydrolase family 19 protein [Pseudocitrobacter faecalis]|uniref:glycoside hydrolase family 19 protein n=1 Tax=Pseudocitrobacter faecalis TaxID=1398493 RepID=UPI00389A7396
MTQKRTEPGCWAETNTEEKRTTAISNGNTQQGDGYKYRGRGCVHLTWKNNYLKAKEKFGIDFVNNPELAGDFQYSVPIMVWGDGRRDFYR